MISAGLLIISFLSLIGVRFITRSGRWRRAWYIFCIANLSAAAILSISSWKKSHRVLGLEKQLVAVREYSWIARLDALGNPPGGGIGSDIKYNTELTNLLRDMYTLKGEQIIMERGSEAEQRYREVIDKYPKFPFGHYFLALCFRERGSVEWQRHAREAVRILKITTQIDGHNSNHDEVLNKVSSWLEQN